MVSSYEDFERELDELIKYRSKNYVNVDCDISVLIDIVFDEITADVNLMWEVEDILIDGSQHTYDIKKVEIDVEGNVTKHYKEITSMVSDDFIDIDLFFDVLDNSQIRINDARFLTEQNGKTIQLMRRVTPSIEILGIELYGLIRSAMIEGVMYHIQTSVPTQVDSAALGNLQYQRFFAAKKLLKDRLPQYKKFDTRNTGSQQKGYNYGVNYNY